MSLILKEIIFAESFYFVKCFLNFLHFLHFPAFLFEGKFDEMSLFCIFSGIFFFVKFNYSPFTEAAFVFSISLERGKRYVFSFYLFTFVSSALSRDFFFFSPSFLSFFYRISLKIEISPRYIKFYRNYFHSAKASSFSSRDTGIFIVNFNIPLMERVIRF